MRTVPPRLAQCVAVALCWGSAAPAAVEPTDKQKREFELARTQSNCTPGSEKHPDYPFSVERLGRALKINRKITQASPQPVQVLVVDNGFFGYVERRSEEEGPSFFESPNYPKLFFRSPGREFLPYLDETDTASRPDAADPMGGHGTHIGGIVLGGMYEKGTPKEGVNLIEPDVRRLLLDNPEVEKAQDAKPWLNMRFVPIGYGAGSAGTDPLDRLGKALQTPAGSSVQIVNMSLTRMLTSVTPPYALPDQANAMLVALAAGNATMPLSRDVQALPARIEDNDRLLVVASHDADGNLSEFSNYGDKVTIAAPGCKILSWTDGESAAVALSGTSMATAVVTFAAALLRSQWENATGLGLRSRLLASAHYEPQLSKCARVKGRIKEAGDPIECVQRGAMLDIAAAIVVRRDLIEYEECPDSSGKGCTRLTAVGDLTAVPTALADCQPTDAHLYKGLTRNGAVKRIAAGNFVIVSDPGEWPGRRPLTWAPCQVLEPKLAELIRFKVSGLQLGEDTVPAPADLTISVGQLVRLVTRVK